VLPSRWAIGSYGCAAQPAARSMQLTFERSTVSCRPNAPFAELVRLSRTSIVDEMREEHRRRVLGE
jgi:hypothetical protein